MQSKALIAAGDTLHSSFPQDPMSEYQHQGKKDFNFLFIKFIYCINTVFLTLALSQLQLKWSLNV